MSKRKYIRWSSEEESELMRLYEKNLKICPKRAVTKSVEEFSNRKGRTSNSIRERVLALKRAKGKKPRYNNYLDPDYSRGRHNIAIGERIMTEMEALGCL